MADPLCRVSFQESGQPSTMVVTGQSTTTSTDAIPCREWSITDDILNMCDTACVTISNIEGENSNAVKIGQRATIEVSDADVAQGQWCRAFTGLVTALATGSDASGGSVIQITMNDVGWYLTLCCAPPLKNIKGIEMGELVSFLLDPSWGITVVAPDNELNRRIKHGRTVIVQQAHAIYTQVLPRIQVEPGQKAFDILQQYAARNGLLIDAGADGSLVLFRPNYQRQADYYVTYHKSSSGLTDENNIVGRPELSQSIDGLYSETQVWSSVVIDPKINNNTDNPNAGLRYSKYATPINPLPFFRRDVITDSEAISEKLRMMRALWRQQMAAFQAWKYEVSFDSHSQDGTFFTSDSMIGVLDEVNAVTGVYYVQAVTRSQTIREGTTAKLTIRKPILDPTNQALVYGGTKGAATTKARAKPLVTAAQLNAVLRK